jgi:hypothetical protein
MQQSSSQLCFVTYFFVLKVILLRWNKGEWTVPGRDRPLSFTLLCLAPMWISDWYDNVDALQRDESISRLKARMHHCLMLLLLCDVVAIVRCNPYCYKKRSIAIVKCDRFGLKGSMYAMWRLTRRTFVAPCWKCVMKRVGGQKFLEGRVRFDSGACGFL